MNHFKISTRLMGAFSILLALTLVISGISYFRVNALIKTNQQIVNVDLDTVITTDRWVASINLNWARTVALLNSSDEQYIKLLSKEMADTSAKVSEMEKKVKGLIDEPKEKELIDAISQARKAYSETRAKAIERKKAGQPIGIDVEKDLRPLANTYLAAMDTFAQYEELQLKKLEDNASEEGQSTLFILMVCTAISLVAGSILAWLSARSIIRPIREAVAVAERIKDGHLNNTMHIEGNDEAAQLLRALSEMQGHLQQIVLSVREGAEGV